MNDPKLDSVRMLADSLLEPVFGIDGGGVVSWQNPTSARRWPQGLGSQASTLFPEQGRSDFETGLRKVLSGGQSVRFEWGEQGLAGVRSWFIATLAPLREGAQITGAWCSSNEVTEYKRTEARLRHSEQLMVDTQGVAHLGTWEWDVTQPTASWSDELYRIYGLTRENYTPSYDAYLTKVHPDDRQRVADATNRVFNEAIPYSHDERIFRPDGSIRYLHTWAHPVRDESGKLLRLVGVCQDITDQKLAEEKVHQLNLELERRVAERTRQLESSMRDLEAFNAMVSHDLRTPLHVMRLANELIALENPQLAPSSLASVERIRASVRRMGDLLEDLLTLARVGRGPVHSAEVDLSALAADVLGQLRLQVPGREVELVIAPGLRCTADPSLMRSALTNLLENAWKYSSRVQRARIEVGPVPGRRNAFFVRDNGAGFDMAQKHRLFMPFERLHAGTEFEGTGVGLATVHRIVERHQGKVWAESAPERGTTFFVELPVS